MDDKRRLKVDLDEVKYAMDSAFDSLSNYLDLDTGEVVSVTDETRQQLEALFEATAADGQLNQKWQNRRDGTTTI